MAYTREQLAELLRSVGFPESAIPTMLQIAQLESNYNPSAFNPNSKTKDLSYGLFQINMFGNMGPERRKWFGIKSNEELLDPRKNAEAAYKLWSSREKSKGKGTGFTHWSTYNKLQEQGNPNLQTGSAMEASSTTTTPSPTTQADISKYIIARALLADPELGAIYKKYLGMQGPEAQDALATDIRNSKWWKRTSETARLTVLSSLKKDEPSYQDARSQKINLIKKANVSLGGELDDAAINSLADKSLLFGWTDEAINSAILESVKYTPGYIKGQAGTVATNLYRGIQDYGFTVSTEGKEFKNYVSDVIKGFRTESDIIGQFRDMAAQMYPQYAQRFKAGATLFDVASPLMYTVANSLSLPYSYDSRDLLSDNLVQRALQEGWNVYTLKQEAKKDNRWQYGEEGWNETLRAFGNVARTWGFSV